MCKYHKLIFIEKTSLVIGTFVSNSLLVLHFHNYSVWPYSFAFGDVQKHG